MSLTNLSKVAASFTNLAKSAASLVNQAIQGLRGFLLKEDGFYLLLEDGGKIILEESAGALTNLTKTSA